MSNWFDDMQAQVADSPTYQATCLALAASANIIELRQMQGMSKRALRKRAGITPYEERLLLNGDPEVPLVVLARCASVLGVTLGQVLGVDDAEGKGEEHMRNITIGMLESAQQRVEEAAHHIAEMLASIRRDFHD